MTHLRAIYKGKIGSILVITILICSSLMGILLFDPKFNTLEAASTWTQTTDKDFYNGTLDNLIIENNGVESELGFKIEYNWDKKSPINVPAGRHNHALATIYDTDKVLLFGGFIGTEMSNDTWIYDLSDNSWTQLIPKNPNNKPSKRYLHNSATVEGTNKVVLFGGWSYPNIVNSDTWIYRHPPIKNGTYISSPYDTGSKSDFKTILWFANIPENTTLKFQIRSAINESFLANESFVGPDGLGSSFYTSSPTDIWSGHDGDRWVQFIAYFSVKLVIYSPVLKYVTISYNCLPNIIVVSPVNNTLISNNKPTFKWTFEDFDSENQKAFQVLIDDELTFSNVDFDSGEQNTAEEQWAFPTGTSYTELPDGVFYWKVRTKDADDAWTEFSSPREIRIDTHAPSSALNFPTNNGFYNNVLEISGIANDVGTGSGIDRIEINIKRLNDNNYWNGTAWVQLNTWLLATGTTNWTYDSSNLEWTSAAKYSIQCRAIDNATNIEQPNIMNIFTIDRDDPKSTIENPMDNNWLNILKIISGSSFDKAGSGINKVEISIQCSNDYNSFDGGPKKDNYWNGITWTSKKTWLLAIGTKEWSYDTTEIPFTTGDHYTIFSRAIDKTNNLETPGLGTKFMFDAKPPENLNIFINNETEYTKSSDVILSLQAEDIGSGLYQMSFSSDSAIWSDWEPFNTTYSFKLPVGDGNKTIYFKVRDYIGNIAEPISDSIILDTTPPEELLIVIDDDSKFTNSQYVKIDLQATDKLSGASEVSFSYDGVNWLSWEPFTQIKYLNIPNDISDGEIKIYFKVKDIASNIAEPVFDTIILDTLPPFSLSIFINDGLSETNSTSVTLALQALDSTSGIDKVSFSTDNESWSAWENFLKTRTYELSTGDGIKIIYFRVKDLAGNEADPVYATIILNTTLQEEEISPEKRFPSGLDFWIIIFIIVFIAIIMVITSMILIRKRRKHPDHEILAPGALTIRPGGLSGPIIAVGQMTEASEKPQLPSVSTGPTSTPQPQLAKSMQTVLNGQTPPVQPTPEPMAQELPALPPVQSQDTIPEPGKTVSEEIDSHKP